MVRGYYRRLMIKVLQLVFESGYHFVVNVLDHVQCVS